MNALNLVVEPFEFLNYMEVYCVKEVNHHGKIRIAGLIQKQKRQEYMHLAEKEIWVSVKAISEKQEEQWIFNGILVNLSVTAGDAPILTIEVVTGSYLLDIIPHTRSFQKIGNRYYNIINACMEPAKGKFIMLEKKEEEVKDFLFQYNETDWEFLKRVSSHAGIVMIPEDEIPGKNVYFGYRKNHISENIEIENYDMERYYERYDKETAGCTRELSSKDTLQYVIKTRELFRLGENIRFLGQDFVIGKIISQMVGQELWNEYHLITEKRGLIPALFNYGLIGVSVKAEVVAVERTMVQIEIKGDENIKNSGKRWFDYATVYSTPDGTGWYCMPEVGDIVRLIFPNEKENNAYVMSSVHVESAQERTNADEKSWMNKQKKQILFTPTSIVMRNNNGVSVEISDQEGIKLCSNKDILLKSEGDVKILSHNGGVQMTATNNILMQQGAAKIEINKDIHINGGKIYMN